MEMMAGGSSYGDDVDNKNNIENDAAKKKKSWKQESSPAAQKPNNGKQPLQQNCSSWTIPFPLVRRTFCVGVRVRYCSVLGGSVLTLHFNAHSLLLSLFSPFV